MDMNIFEEWIKIGFQKCHLITNKRQRDTGRSNTRSKHDFQLKTGKPKGPIPLSGRRRRHRKNNVT
jgi:hypothetical protein